MALRSGIGCRRCLRPSVANDADVGVSRSKQSAVIRSKAVSGSSDR